MSIEQQAVDVMCKKVYDVSYVFSLVVVVILNVINSTVSNGFHVYPIMLISV